MIDAATSLDTGVDTKFWLIFEQAAVGVALISPQGRYLRANPELCKMLGYTEEQLRALNFEETTHPDDVAAGKEILARLIADDSNTHRTEKRYVRRDGRTIWGLVSVSLVRDDAGAPLHFISIMQDITERKQVQAKLEQTRNRYQAICDSVSDFIAVTDLRGNFLFASASSARLLGYAVAEMVGTNLFRYVHPDERTEVREAYTKFNEGSNETLKVRYRFFRKDGSYIRLETKARPFSGVGDSEREIVCISSEAHEQVREALVHEKSYADETARPALDPRLTDGLTGLRNRINMDELLGAKLVSKRSAKFPFGVLFVEIDHLMTIQESYGKAASDEVVKRVATVLHDACREEDLVARYGDDQFMIVLPTTNAGGTIVVGEKLIRHVKAIDFSDTPVRSEITASIGATCIVYGAELTLPELIAILDEQLQQAKEAGRNRLVMNTKQTSQKTGRPPG
jgi:diguanylate cyclase (GGDEF)-like protein/PAS domain S-box-containing protein